MTTPLYFSEGENKGGPTVVIYGFEDAYSALFKNPLNPMGYLTHPLYHELYKLHIRNLKHVDYSSEHPKITEFGPPPPNFQLPVAEEQEAEKGEDGLPSSSPQPANPPPTQDHPAPEPVPGAASGKVKGGQSAEGAGTEGQRTVNGDENVMKFDAATVALKKRKKCDEIFAEYLSTVAKVVKKDWYREIILLVFLFRECLNSFGQRLQDPKPVSSLPLPSDPGGKEDYCLTNNAEQAPEVSNEFVTEYIDRAKPGFDRNTTIEFTQNLCSWLFNNGYTCSRLSLINDSSQ